MKHRRESFTCEQGHDHESMRTAVACDVKALHRWKAWAQLLAMRLSAVADAVNSDESWRGLILCEDPPAPPEKS